jgi:hemoglobin
MMKPDITTRRDLEILLQDFYTVAMPDAEIGHHFDDLDLETHLPIIVDFWEKVLFGKPVYFNNPLAVHQRLHEKFPLLPAHFDRWVEIFSAIVDKHFEGEMAELAKVRARVIGNNLDQRLNGGVRIQSKV